MGVIDADTTWISSLVLYTLQALMSAERWEKVVQVGTRYHFLSGGKRFSEQALPLLVFAQQQFLRQQEVILSSAQAHLDAFVTSFMESEAKKKKKKSRLVIEEVLTPEEVEFRTKRATMEAELDALRIERDRRSRDLQELQRIQDGLMRTMNKAVQALDKCHELIEKYQRGEKTQGLRSQIIGAFNQCVVLARQKRQLKLTCQALQELGDFFWDQGDSANATKSWQEGLDNAFNTLRVTQAWRHALSVEHLDENEFFRELETRLQGDGMWLNLQSCAALAKLMLHGSNNKTFEVVEYALMAASILRRILRCSFPHPTRDYLYGTYVIVTPIWSGRELLVDTEKLSPHQFSTALIAISQALLLGNHAVEAMPVIACYESVMSRYVEDRDHSANARRLRVEALATIGRFAEAMEMLLSLLSGSSRFSCFEGKYGMPRVTGADFLGNKLVNDAANASFSSWLATIDVGKLQSSLAEHYSRQLIQLILLTLLRFVVQVVYHEPIGTSGSLRPTVNKLAGAILTLVSNTDAQEQPSPRDFSSRDRESIQQLRAEIQLQQSLVTSFEGSWAPARAIAAKAEAQLLATDPEKDNTRLATISLDQTMPFLLLSERNAIIARCRLQMIKCDIARGQWHDALQHADTAASHCRMVGDLRCTQLFELSRAETLILLGRTDDAVERLVSLCEDMKTHHTSRTLPHIQARIMLAALQRARALENNDRQLLAGVLETLSIAEDSLDQLLRRDGWIGVNVDPETDPRLNLYHPAIPMFVRLKAELARALMEAPCADTSEVENREKRAMQCVMQGLQAIEHTSKPLGALKARLLFLRGAIEKKRLLNKALPSSSTAKAIVDADQVLHCSSTLREAIRTSIRDGAHDRELIRIALLELVDIFGEKLVPGQEDEHVQAAFHYLTTAHNVLSQERSLFHSNELQAASVTAPDALPSFVIEAILRQSAGSSDAIEKATPALAATGASGGKNAATTSLDAAHKKPALDGERIINYFVSVLRERQVLVTNPLIEETTSVLHKFLVQNHATYSKVCCLADLPPVPVEDPEIQAGLVCTIWGRDLTPALTKREGGAPMTPVLYFTLGTTRIEAPAEEDSPQWRRAERFATAPLLSKRPGLRDDHVRSIQQEISRLRVQMEDEDSLVIDRSSFDAVFFGILRRIQQLLREPLTTKRKKAKSEAPEAFVRDAFGTIIPITCSLPVVRQLEQVFNTTRSVSSCDNALCYFLRDLLDASSGDPVAPR
ncbi:hypothetical protein PINS_up006314 [Pythium insidiosum]|nr:hypothetical protein PINS_up006314 [Pythium insidiosum]